MRPGRERRRGPEGRAREIPALLFAALWLLGFEAGPALHLARHATLPEHDHCHGGVCHGDGDAVADPGAVDADAADPDAPDHGEGSLEHGGLAVLAPAPIVAAIAGVAIAEMVAPAAEPAPPGDIARERPRARAPPADVSRA